MKGLFVKYCVFFLVLISGRALYAQVDVKSQLEKDSILVGEHVEMLIEAIKPESYKMLWPELEDTLTKDIEIIEKSPIDTSQISNEDLVKLSGKLKLTAWDSGYYVVPPITFSYISKDDTVPQKIKTDPILLSVYTVPVDTTAAIKDIKAPMAAPYTLADFLPWIIGALILAVIIFFLYRYLNRRQEEAPVIDKKPVIRRPPHEIALEELEQLKLKKLWQSGKVKHYHSELTEIIRKYIEYRFAIPALEMTSDEIMDRVEYIREINPEVRSKLGESLLLADMVKFAKQEPLPLEHDVSLNNMFDFVRETVPAVELRDEEPSDKTEKEKAVTK